MNRPAQYTVADCMLIDLPRHTRPNGNLTVVENTVEAPFEIKRVYYLYDVPAGAERGGHAHKVLQQFIIAVSGSFDVTIDDGSERRTVTLNRPFNIVPAKILTEILKMVHDTEDTIDIMLARKHVIFKIGEFTYFSRLIDGEYINYKRIIPEKFERMAYINTDSIKGAAERASIVTEDKLGGSSAKTYIKLEFEGNELKITSASTGGSVYESIPVSMTGEELVIAFNCRFLLDALKACDDAETVCFKMNGSLMGICIEKANGGEEEEEKVRYMLFVMPLRMNGK